jgi:hypothetical protein
MSKARLDSAPAPVGHPPAWILERVAFEPEAVDAEARRHSETCASCRLAVAQLTEARSQFLAGRPARPFLALVRERSSHDPGRATRSWPPHFGSTRWLLVPAAAAVAVLLVLVLPPRLSWREAVHMKGGGVALRIFAAREGQVAHPIEPGTALRPGDLLRFGVVAPGARNAFVASVDEVGRFSRYYPAGGTAGAALDGSGGLQLLPGSVELDDTTGREWIVLLVSQDVLDEDEVREALLLAWRERQGDRLGHLALAADAVIVPVNKVAR